MDDDIHDALFNDEDADGLFEELQDDFISQAMTEPVVLDFDYDAHIANLIARRCGVVLSHQQVHLFNTQ